MLLIEFPIEILIEIFNYLPLYNLILLEKVNRILKLIIRKNKFQHLIKIQSNKILKYILKNYYN